MKHKITALEPATIETTFWYDTSEQKIVSGDCFNHPADGESHYSCSCGEEFYSWDEAKEHMKDSVEE